MGPSQSTAWSSAEKGKEGSTIWRRNPRPEATSKLNSKCLSRKKYMYFEILWTYLLTAVLWFIPLEWIKCWVKQIFALVRVIDKSKGTGVRWNSGSLWPLITYTELGKVFMSLGLSKRDITFLISQANLLIKCFPTYVARLQVTHTQVWCSFRRHNSTFIWLKPVSSTSLLML